MYDSVLWMDAALKNVKTYFELRSIVLYTQPHCIHCLLSITTA